MNMARESLAARLRAGDKEAANELVDIYYEHVYFFMRRLGYNCHASEDLTQETFLQAWHHIGQLKEGGALNGWLYRIAANVAKMRCRDHKVLETSRLGQIDVAASDKADFEKAAHYEELEKLRNAVTRLPIKLRQAIVLHYMQHLSVSEAAVAAEVREGTFKSRLNRGLKILRNYL